MRWLGPPLFLLGVLEVLVALGQALQEGSIPTLLVAVGATGLSLGTFGLHNDTALALAQQVPAGRLDPALQRELDAERAEHPAELVELTPSPRAAAVATLLALLLHGVVILRLFGPEAR